MPLRLVGVVTRAALDVGVPICDLSADPDTLEAQFALDETARARHMAIVPACGEAPGLGSNLQAYALTLLDEPTDLLFYDGGLPLDPEPPWNYRLTFHVDGLLNEYAHPVTWIREGEPITVRNLDPDETVTIELDPPLGTMEAFPSNAGGTLVRTLAAGLRTYEARVLRYPGHVAQMNAFRDLGLFGTEPVDVGGAMVVPRDLLLAAVGTADRRRRGRPRHRDRAGRGLRPPRGRARQGGRRARATSPTRRRASPRWSGRPASTRRSWPG